MKMNEKIIRYLDGDMLPEEIIDFEKELSGSAELMQQLISVSSALKKTKILKEAEINNDYFVNMIPAFRNKQSSKQKGIANPVYAGGVIMIVTLLMMMLFQYDWDTNSTIQKETVTNEFNREEIDSLLSNINYDANEFDLTASDEMNLDSLINTYIIDDILISSGNGSTAIQSYQFNPDEIQLSDAETENLYTAILNKKFF